MLTAKLPALTENAAGDVFFDDLYNQHGKIPIIINPNMLSSDEAIVGVLTHELHEPQNFRHAFASQGGRMSFDDFFVNQHQTTSAIFTTKHGMRQMPLFRK